MGQDKQNQSSSLELVGQMLVSIIFFSKYTNNEMKRNVEFLTILYKIIPR